MLKEPIINNEDFLRGGGEMGERIRSFDWGRTPLGPPHRWPQSLKTCIRIMLTSRQPIWIGWGKDLIKFYNDPYRAIVGGKHPDALGKPASYVWRDIWRDIEPMLHTVMEENEGTYSESQLLIMERNGYREETYYTFSYTPIPGDTGGTAGMICANTDNTDRVLSERQLSTLTILGKSLLTAMSPDEVYNQTFEVLAQNPFDFPFAIFYQVDSTHDVLSSRWKIPSTIDADVFPEAVSLKNLPARFDGILQVINNNRIVAQPIDSSFGILPSGPWEHTPEWLLHIPVAGQKGPYSVLSVGMNPYRQRDEKYLGFFQLVADQVASRLAQVMAMDEERKRAEALAEIDRAKTIFFSNISHEFRTPLTLMLGPLDDLLQNPNDLNEAHLGTLKTAHRNALRLLKLVNTLLDFSRLESGRQKANFTPVDIGEFTRNLASNFRSVIEKAGLNFEVNIATAPQPSNIDKNFWEAILFNLLSNAFKYTLQGSITVTLDTTRQDIVLKVEDTGVGIPAAELPRMFQRFHRVQDSKGRSHEGTGIGLSMVKELVHLMNGTIEVQSEEGKGSTFTVTLPQHAVTTPDVSTSPTAVITKTNLYVAEAGSLLAAEQQPVATKTESDVSTTGRPTVLIVDDNADMRQYLESLLRNDYALLFAGDGQKALHIILSPQPPDMIISDIMMPVMDGIQLLKATKGNRVTSRIPFILLSARAGEEARIEGYDIGADDYLVKPFSAKELQSRVRAQLNIAQTRRQVEHKLESLFVQAPVALCILRGSEFILEFVNDAMLELWGRTKAETINKPIFEALPDVRGQGFEALLENVFTTGVRYLAQEAPVTLLRYGVSEPIFVKFVFEPLLEDDGYVSGIMVVADEITSQALARQQIEESDSRQRIALETAELGAWDLDFETDQMIRNLRYAQIFGYTDTALPWTSQKWLEHTHPDDRAYVLDKIIFGRANGYFDLETRIVRVDNAVRWIRSRAKVFYDDKGMPRRMVGVIQDITGQKLATEELERKVDERTRNLKEANTLLERTNHELEQFAYIASHDLQEPLRKIQTFASFLNNSFDNPEAFAKYHQKILSAAQRMSQLIQDVLHYSRLTRSEDAFGPVNLNDILDIVRQDFELLLAEKEGVVHSDNLPVIDGISLQISQLFTNLVSNALKFCREKPQLVITSRTLTPADVKNNPALNPSIRYCQLSFADNGIGFEQQYAEQIFQIFQRLQSDYQGTGIGLALCKKIVDNHDGYIEAFSVAGKGSTFNVCLPLYDAAVPT